MKNSLLSTLLLLAFSVNTVAQDLTVPRIFNDHMVLQHDADVRIWGWAKPGAVVSIMIDGADVITSADDSGKWEAFLPKHEAGGPYSLTVSSKKKITFSDVYFGDVWVAGGQSNMEWPVGGNIDNMEAELNDANYPEIRFYKVAQRVSFSPMDDLAEGEWKVANKENAKGFSAVAWFFAKHNHAEKNVPVGIIDDNWGGTPAESWVPAERLLTVPGYEDMAADMLDSDTDWDTVLKENQDNNAEKYRRVEDQTEYLSLGAHTTDYNDSGWREVELPNSSPLRDFVWLRKTFELSSVEDGQLSFGNPGKFTQAFINGEKVYNKIWSDDPEVINIDASVLKEGENVIAIRTVEDWSNTTYIGSEDNFWIQVGDQKTDLSGTWKFSNTVEPPMPEVIRYEHRPGTLYNGMINPVAGYTIKGAIWYQGESNVARNEYYNVLFESMIEEWRTAWNQGSFPFLFVQLANFQQKYDKPTDSGWARLQEAQTQTLSLANTGMATIIDIGDANDIHPRNKQDVGYRLWQSARHVAYNEDNVYSGPMYRGHIIDGNEVVISFDHIGSGFMLRGSDEIEGFAVAGSDSVFHWADARIVDNKIIVSSPEVDDPVAVRYAWADNPDVSLYNKELLPAVPFRTDDW